MRDPEEYADRVRAHPYGPVDVTAGPVATWLHGPYVVLALTGTDGRSVMLTGAGDDAGLAVDLAEFFEAAVLDGGELSEAGRLGLERQAGGGEPERVTRWHAGVRQGSRRLTLHAGATVVAVHLDPMDATVHAEAIRTWADAISLDSQNRSAGVRPPGRSRS